MGDAVQCGLPFEDDKPQRLIDWQPEWWPVARGWEPVVQEFLASDAGRQLGAFVRARLAAGTVIYPPRPFRALELTPPERVRVVVLGQDPYHGPGQAEGLAFSVREGVKLPRSLQNIFSELGCKPPHGSLADWAKQGVLLLNPVLTVEQGKPNSHAGVGWEALTDALLRHVAGLASPCVYMLWGAPAQRKRELIESNAKANQCEVLVLTSSHPSPLAARRTSQPFLGCGHFELARRWLAGRGHPGLF